MRGTTLPGWKNRLAPSLPPYNLDTFLCAVSPDVKRYLIDPTYQATQTYDDMLDALLSTKIEKIDEGNMLRNLIQAAQAGVCKIDDVSSFLIFYTAIKKYKNISGACVSVERFEPKLESEHVTDLLADFAGLHGLTSRITFGYRFIPQLQLAHRKSALRQYVVIIQDPAPDKKYFPVYNSTRKQTIIFHEGIMNCLARTINREPITFHGILGPFKPDIQRELLYGIKCAEYVRGYTVPSYLPPDVKAGFGYKDQIHAHGKLMGYLRIFFHDLMHFYIENFESGNPHHGLSISQRKVVDTFLHEQFEKCGDEAFKRLLASYIDDVADAGLRGLVYSRLSKEVQGAFERNNFIKRYPDVFKELVRIIINVTRDSKTVAAKLEHIQKMAVPRARM